MSNQSPVPHPCARVVLEPLAAAGLGGSGHGGRGAGPRLRWRDDLGQVLQKRLPCVLLPVPLQEQLYARHVSRKNPLNPCSNWELRLTGLVLVAQAGPIRLCLGPARRLLAACEEST